MRIFQLFSVAAFAAMASPALCQDALPGRPVIVVSGSAEVSAPPDRFAIDVTISGRGDTQVAALRALATVQDRVVETLPNLDGVEDVRLTTDDVELEPVYDRSCGDRYDENRCPVVGYTATMDIQFEAAPATKAGDALSLASELGATSVRLNAYSLSEIASLRQEADRAAYADARQQADGLAGASGSRVVRVIRIQDASVPPEAFAEATEVDEVVVTGSRVRPAVSLVALPKPVVARSRLTVIFEIE
jgi:uncharacterized protein YggE